MIKPDRIVTTTCPYCGVGCNLQLHVKDDFIYKVTSPFDSPVNHGNLCVKGRFGYDFVYHPKRITTPLVRRYLLEGKSKPDGREQVFAVSTNGDPIPNSLISNDWDWVATDWDTALNLVADNLVRIYERDGSDAMAVYCCAKATNEDNYLLQKMFRALFRTNNVDHCTRLCHAGSVVALQMALGSSAMSNTAAEVIHSDVFLVTGSNTAETHPIIALQMKAAVANHGAKLIVVDPRRVEMVNSATLWLPEKPGTDVPLFSAMAHVIVKERLYNEDFIRHGTDNAMALIHLTLLTGHIGRKGTGLNPLRGQNNVQGASDSGAMPWHYPGYQRFDDEAPARKFEQAWNIEPGGLSRKLGLTTTEILSAVGPGGVRALHIMGENPMMSEPNLNHTRHMMEQLEFLVAQDLFINESGAYADVFFPAASWAEKDGTFTNTDRRVQRVRTALEPRGQSRPDSGIICRLAERIEKRLGRPKSALWAYHSPAEVLEEMGSVVPEYSGVKYRRIEKEGLQTPVWDDSHPGTPYLFAESFPSGRGKFHPLEYVPSVEMPDDEYPFILTTGRLLEHWHGGTLTRHSKLDDLYPEARIEINPADAARLKIEDGQAARVSSRRGSIVLHAWVTQRTTLGVVFVPMHFVEAAANLLTIDALDARAKIPEYKACAVRIVPAHEHELAKPDAKVQRGRY